MQKYQIFLYRGKDKYLDIVSKKDEINSIKRLANKAKLRIVIQLIS